MDEDLHPTVHPWDGPLENWPSLRTRRTESPHDVVDIALRTRLRFCLTQSASYCRTVGTLRNRYKNTAPSLHSIKQTEVNSHMVPSLPTSRITAHAHGRRRDTRCCHTNRTWQTSPPRVCLMVSWNRSCGGKPQKPRTPFAWRQHAQDRKLSRGCHVIADFPVQQAQS